ncbi:hypothetical protein IVA95_27955 [Bradyrhizobium sp. 157]|uniref:hypothetical protein n=1 Tax=Bradyrhizobium sp. 157 TaxID=2782631 RepID=UPI001FF9FE43|nr:hypothetical protein [Bradyrhizobium sp. 157]MCK1641309.1 hypothetical protein [Bradyrhizobium sp. 157]
MPLQCATQWDALGHVYYDDPPYNGFKARECLTEKGAHKMGINHLASPAWFRRGALKHCAVKVVERLPLDYAITLDGLNAACEKEGVS